MSTTAGRSGRTRRAARRCRGSGARVALSGAAAVSAVALAGALLPGPAEASVRTAAPFCGLTWGSLPRTAGSTPGMPTAAVAGLRSGRHACYDRVVWDLTGPAPAVRVAYVPAVTGDASGRVVPLRGGAALHVVLQGTSPRTWPGTGLELVASSPTVRQVSWAEGFEGYDTYGVGVRARLPFRVFVLPGPGTWSRVVLDVAHRW